VKVLKELAQTLVYHVVLGYESEATKPVSSYRLPRDHPRLYYSSEAKPRWSFLLANEACTTRQLGSPSKEERYDCKSELTQLCQRLAKTGPLVAVDRTPPAVSSHGVSVVSVVAGGLQPIHFGLEFCRRESRRLSTWRFPNGFAVDDITDHQGLNPLPHPFS
jgi:hypothetical protein